MQISIRYQLRNDAVSRKLDLSPEDYFDPAEPGESYSVRSVPRLSETYQYTPHCADELAWTVVEIRDGTAFWRVRTQLLDGLRSLMNHSQDADGSEEIIHQTEISPQCWHTIRTLKDPGKAWAVTMNNLTVEQKTELTASADYCALSSFDELRAFGSAV